jgi:nucleoside-triphosphatase THEP1
VIHEYALQPSLLKSWATNDRDYAEFLREYGLGSPRLISSFPKQKVSKFRSYLLSEGPADEQSRDAGRYLEMVNKLLESLVFRNEFECLSPDWVENVKAENERIPFNVVLTENKVDVDECLTPDGMYVLNSAWNHKRQRDIKRTHEYLNQAVKNLLRLSKDKVVIIDAFGWTEKAISTIHSLIGQIFVNRVHSEIPELYLYYKEKVDRKATTNSSPSASEVKSKIVQSLNGIEAGLKINVVELRQLAGNDVFHNRCILTEHGGVSLENGIDLSNDPNHTDEIKLMEKEIYDKKWRQFVDDNCFEVVSES